MTEPRDRQEKIFSLVMDIGISLLLFILPFKFGLPFIPSLQPVLPMNAHDWLVFCWPNEVILAAVFSLCFVWLAYRLLRGKLQILRSPANIPMLAFTVISLCSAFHSADRFRTAQSLLLTLAYCAAFFLFMNNVRRERVHVFMTVLLCAAAALALYGLHQHFVGLAETREWVSRNMDLSKYPERFSWRLASNRVFATFVYPNALGGYLAMLIVPVSAMPFLLRKPTLYLGPALCAAGMGCAALFVGAQSEMSIWALAFAAVWPLSLWAVFVLSYSNGSFAALAGAALLASGASRRKIVWALPLCAVAAAAAVVAAFPDKLVPLLKIASLSARIDYWKAGFEMILDNPVLGSGPGTFGALYSRYMLAGAEETQLAHNAYIQVWIESGTAAFAAYCAFWILPAARALMRIRKSVAPRREKIFALALAIGLGAFVLHNAVDFDHFIPALVLTALVFMACLRLMTENEDRHITIRARSRLLRMIGVSALSAVTCALILAAASHCYSSYLQLGATRAAAAGKMDTAETMAIAATAYNPFNSSAYYLVGNLHERQRDFANARRAYERAVAESPNIAAYRYSLGRVLLSSGRTDPRRGILELMKAVQAYPANERYRKDLADCLKNYDVDIDSLGKDAKAVPAEN